jgi:hypothetical protein
VAGLGFSAARIRCPIDNGREGSGPVAVPAQTNSRERRRRPDFSRGITATELPATLATETLLAEEKGFMETLERVQGFPTASKVG